MTSKQLLIAIFLCTIFLWLKSAWYLVRIDKDGGIGCPANSRLRILRKSWFFKAFAADFTQLFLDLKDLDVLRREIRADK